GYYSESPRSTQRSRPASTRREPPPNNVSRGVCLRRGKGPARSSDGWRVSHMRPSNVWTGCEKCPRKHSTKWWKGGLLCCTRLTVLAPKNAEKSGSHCARAVLRPGDPCAVR